MAWQFNPLALPLFVCAVPLALVVLVAWQRQVDRAASYFLYFAILVLVLVVSYGFELLSADLPTMMFWLRWEYLGHWLLVFFFLFILEHTGHERWFRGWRALALFAVPAVTLALVWTNDHHGLIWATTGIGEHNGLVFFDRTYGPAFWVWAAYAYSLMGFTALLIVKAAVRAPALYRAQLMPLLLGSAIPLATAALTIARLTPMPYLDLFPYGVAVMWLPITYSLLRFRLLDLLPVAHDMIVHNLRDAVLVTNERGQIVEANPSAEILVEQPVDSLIGRPLHEVLRSDAGFPPAFSGQADEHLEVVLSKGEDRQYLDVHISSLRDWRGRERGQLFVIRDVTARRTAEQQAHQLELERERISILSDFIRDASHEFRTPLTVIQLAARALSRTDDPQKRQQKADQIIEQSDKIVRLVEDLVLMTRLDSAAALPLCRVDVNVLAQIAVQNAQSKHTARRITFCLDLTPDLLTTRGSRDDLCLALVKLLDNAAQHSPDGAAVTLRTRRANGTLTIAVHDQGSGIRQDDLCRVFERFYRADSAHTTSGFGLGLPITQRIVHLHGGQIHVESAPGKGSTFTISLPVV